MWWTLLACSGSTPSESTSVWLEAWEVMAAPAAPVEVCDGLDNDGDGLIDEGEVHPGDADGDGYAAASGPGVSACKPELGGDCDDGDPTVHPGAVESCDDEVDRDCDRQVSCEDADCADKPICEEPPDPDEDCDQPGDEDLDGLADCEDADCLEHPSCVEQVCDDGLDEDQDGRIDCEDADCWTPACERVLVQLDRGSWRFEDWSISTGGWESTSWASGVGGRLLHPEATCSFSGASWTFFRSDGGSSFAFAPAVMSSDCPLGASWVALDAQQARLVDFTLTTGSWGGGGPSDAYVSWASGSGLLIRPWTFSAEQPAD